MKKFVLFSLTCLFATIAYGQRLHFKSIYTNVDTIVVENAPTPFQTEDGDYMIRLQKSMDLVVAYNNEKTKAIVLHGYMWAKRMEYNVKDDAIRLILWFKDKHLYCGYIYDKKTKECQYFEAINSEEKDEITKKFPFLKKMPTFTDK